MSLEKEVASYCPALLADKALRNGYVHIEHEYVRAHNNIFEVFLPTIEGEWHNLLGNNAPWYFSMQTKDRPRFEKAKHDYAAANLNTKYAWISVGIFAVTVIAAGITDHYGLEGLSKTMQGMSCASIVGAFALPIALQKKDQDPSFLSKIAPFCNYRSGLEAQQVYIKGEIPPIEGEDDGEIIAFDDTNKR